MKPLGILGAVIGGAIGAVAWALIGWKLDAQISYVAWGVGLLVGFLSYAMGGRGVANGVTCAAIALLSMFIGKILAIKFVTGEKLPGMENLLGWGDYVTVAKETLGAMDIVFGILGIASAFQLGGRPDEATVYSHAPVGAGYQPPVQPYRPPVEPQQPAPVEAAPAAPPAAPLPVDPIPTDFEPAKPPADPPGPDTQN